MLRWSGSSVLVFFMIPVLSGANAFSQSNSIDREHDAIVISGEMLAPFAGAPIGDLFLYSFDSQTKVFTQIPFQFDERGISGTDTSFFITDDGRLDDDDELAFMASDLGDRDPANPPIAPGNWLSDVISMTNPRVEISLTDVLGSSTLSKSQGLAQGWAYLFRSSSLTKEFTEDYVTYAGPTSGGNDTVVGETYTVGAGAKGFYNDLFLPNAPSTDLLDRQKIRGRLFGPFSEDDFSFNAVEAIDGPVRVVRNLDLTFLILNVSLPFQYYRSSFTLGGNLDIPSGLITEIRHSVDLSNNAIGMAFTNANNTDIPVDGTVDTPNTQIEKSPEFNYTHVTGAQGTIIQVFVVPDSIGDAQDLFYQDETGINDPGDGDAIGDHGIIVKANTGGTVSGKFPLALDMVLLGPNQPSSIGGQLVQFKENPLVIDTLSQTFNQVVPVELASFTASVEKSDIRLIWITASETNNFGFDIERSSHVSEDWQKIDFVEGKGTTSAPVRYEYKDEGLPAGAYHYRLKQIDTDGSFEYSQVINANIGLPETFALQQNFPNPFNPATTINYEIPAGLGNTSEIVQTTVTIYNLLGVEVRKLVAGEKRPGFYSISWNGQNDEGSEVSSGVYLYRLQAGKFTDTKKMLLVR